MEHGQRSTALSLFISKGCSELGVVYKAHSFDIKSCPKRNWPVVTCAFMYSALDPSALSLLRGSCSSISCHQRSTKSCSSVNKPALSRFAFHFRFFFFFTTIGELSVTAALIGSSLTMRKMPSRYFLSTTADVRMHCRRNSVSSGTKVECSVFAAALALDKGPFVK